MNLDNLKQIKTKNTRSIFFLIFIMTIFMTTMFVSAQTDIPIGLQRIIDHNQQATTNFALNISFFIAFVAGILGILSPCILPFLPAYFSYTYKEKKNITKMTGVFFLGFSLVFVSMGVIAGFVGTQTLVLLQKKWLVMLAGAFLIFLGTLTFMGKGFSSFLKLNQKFKNDVPGTFLFGISFALGWTACLGPILSGILGIGVILNNIGYSALLLFFYSLGNVVPLFILSIFYDKFNLAESRFIKGKMLNYNFFGKKYQVHSTNLISGLLLSLIGLILIIYQGTAIFNTWDFLGTKQYFYSLQRQLIGWQYANILGIVSLIIFVLLLYFALKKFKDSSKSKV